MAQGVSRTSSGSLEVEFDRFTRANAESRLRASVASSAGSNKSLRLWIDRDYLAAVDVELVTPQPEVVEAAPDRLTYEFRVGDGDGAAEVAFRLKPRRFGWHTAAIGLEGGERVVFRQLVYP